MSSQIRKQLEKQLLKNFANFSEDEVLNFKNLIIQKRKDREEKRKRIPLPDYETFLNTYFEHYLIDPRKPESNIKVNPGPVQKELYKAIERLSGRSTRQPIRQSIAAPRGYGKSSIVTLVGVLWLILKKEHKFVIILSSIKGTSQGFLQAIIDEIEQNEKLLEDFPELEPARDSKNQFVAWRDSEIVFKNGVRIMALGFLNSLRGLRKKNARPDLVICDDPDEEKDVNSETTMKKKYRWLERAVLRLGGIIGVDVFVCYTTIKENCVGEYIYLNKSRKFTDWIRMKFKAIEKDDSGNEFSTWPEGYSLEELRKERDTDPIGFATERQNEVIAELDQQFKGLIHTYPFNIRDIDGPKTLAIDLSLGKSETSDYSAIIGVLRTKEGRYREIYSDIQRRSTDKIVEDIIKALSLFQFDLCGIETSGNQEHFLNSFLVFLAEHNKRTNRPITTPIEGIPNTGDKIRRVVSTLQPLVKNQWLILREDSELLFNQLDEFPHGYKDGPDALEMAIQLHKTLEGKQASLAPSEIRNPEETQKPRTLREIQIIKSRRR